MFFIKQHFAVSYYTGRGVEKIFHYLPYSYSVRNSPSQNKWLYCLFEMFGVFPFDQKC